MLIPWTSFQPNTLRCVIEEFVSRDGTDYGQNEASIESKIDEVYKLLRARKAIVVFDPETENVNIQSCG